MAQSSESTPGLPGCPKSLINSELASLTSSQYLDARCKDLLLAQALYLFVPPLIRETKA